MAETVSLPSTRPPGNKLVPPPSSLSVCSTWPALPPGSTVRTTESEERLTPGTTRAMGLTLCIPDKKTLYVNSCQIFLGIVKLGQIFSIWKLSNSKLENEFVTLTLSIFILKIDSLYFGGLTTSKEIGMIHRNVGGKKISCFLLRCKIIQYMINKIGTSTIYVHFVYLRA